MNKVLIFFILLSACWGCTKLVKIPEPVDTVTSSEVFSSDALATSAVAAIYNDMTYFKNNGLGFCRGGATIYMGLSADELIDFGGNNPFQSNTLLSTYGQVNTLFWSAAYYDIYLSNAVIEGLQSSTGVSEPAKTQLTGEAKFVRAFCYFYLVNLFGDVPLVLTTSWNSTSLLARTPSEEVYQQIKADLTDAQNLLNDGYLKPDNTVYPIATAERTRVNKSAATALLARVYLYMKDYPNAESLSTKVINNNSFYNLVTTGLSNVFKANSFEAIWQLQPVSAISPYTVFEANQLLPTNNTSSPSYYVTMQLLNSFEANDQRKNSWLSSTLYMSNTYYYPYKYRSKTGTAGTAPSEYYTMLRLAEQFLIRAEARAQQNINLSGAIADLNTIRTRAGLPGLPLTLTQAQVLTAIMHERRIELFSEWGHRWLDLKRTGAADSSLSPIKSQWQPTDKFYPIPFAEIQKDPNLIQNTGY